MTDLLTRISLDELDSAGVRIECAPDVAAAIHATQLVTMEPALDGGYIAKPTGNVGAVRVGDLQIEVRPKGKVKVSQVLFLLGYARDPGFRPDDVTAEADTDLLPVLAESLARQAQRALARGVHQGYVTIDESARTVKGRIRMGDQIARRPGLLLPLEVTYDDFSPDVPENRILRTALRRMAAVPRVPAATRERLRRLDANLDQVSTLEKGEPLPRWTPTRLNSRYHSALRLSELILRHLSARTGGNGPDIASFVVPMWKVFEDFVAVALAEALRDAPGVTEEQYPVAMDEPIDGVPAIRMNVDIVHSIYGHPVFVADAKYKAASPDGQYPNADKYQMLAYCTALGVRNAWLVYARGGEPVTRRVRNSDVEITEWPLDLAGSPRKVLEQVHRLSASLVQLRQSAHTSETNLLKGVNVVSVQSR
jgi:5-methylcytosine-specific restriction enzyme subunit McrC